MSHVSRVTINITVEIFASVSKEIRPIVAKKSIYSLFRNSAGRDKKERKAIANLFALHAKEKKVKNKCTSATLTFFENLKISFQCTKFVPRIPSNFLVIRQNLKGARRYTASLIKTLKGLGKNET